MNLNMLFSQTINMSMFFLLCNNYMYKSYV
jgi:hypothetical protein